MYVLYFRVVDVCVVDDYLYISSWVCDERISSTSNKLIGFSHSLFSSVDY